MDFFVSMTTEKTTGLVLLAAGAVLTFVSRPVSAKIPHKHANLIVKCIGLAVVFCGFALIMFV